MYYISQCRVFRMNEWEQGREVSGVRKASKFRQEWSEKATVRKGHSPKALKR